MDASKLRYIVKPEDYDVWYQTPRGRWIGETEYSLLKSLLRPEPGSSLLDIGCGTGHFTRLFARSIRGCVVGIDPNGEWLSYARAHAANGEGYIAARAEALPFPDRAFEFSVSVTALCFVRDQEQALRELIRVTRRRFVLGLLNRRSLLYLQKGRGGGTGGYYGARWHTASEVRALFESLPVTRVVMRTAILLPMVSAPFVQALESLWPRGVLWGGFLAVAGEVSRAAPNITPQRTPASGRR